MAFECVVRDRRFWLRPNISTGSIHVWELGWAEDVGAATTERGPDIVRMPSMGQKRTISGMRTISEGLKILC